ncbi:hypothetical protein DFJ74DRAFT_763859 [Hyaloraphidium curvatum]|nr:hypothetical protein DFJ74DRAFT_763859 [Hyaloraphidium curvatum]
MPRRAGEETGDGVEDLASALGSAHISKQPRRVLCKSIRHGKDTSSHRVVGGWLEYFRNAGGSVPAGCPGERGGMPCGGTPSVGAHVLAETEDGEEIFGITPTCGDCNKARGRNGFAQLSVDVVTLVNSRRKTFAGDIYPTERTVLSPYRHLQELAIAWHDNKSSYEVRVTGKTRDGRVVTSVYRDDDDFVLTAAFNAVLRDQRDLDKLPAHVPELLQLVLPAGAAPAPTPAKHQRADLPAANTGGSKTDHAGAAHPAPSGRAATPVKAPGKAAAAPTTGPLVGGIVNPFLSPASATKTPGSSRSLSTSPSTSPASSSRSASPAPADPPPKPTKRDPSPAKPDPSPAKRDPSPSKPARTRHGPFDAQGHPLNARRVAYDCSGCLKSFPAGPHRGCTSCGLHYCPECYDKL